MKLIFPLSLLAMLAATAEPEPAAMAATPPPVDGSRVAVLGYHDFSATEPETEMRIRTAKFRKQMEFIRDAGYTVISLDAFTQWKHGNAQIPEKSILLTLDDGWKSVYTDAFPILREFHYPFTLFLYKNYIECGGKSLTSTMILEMMEHGASIGSHSVSHPFPITFRSHRNKGPDDYDLFLRKEIGESKRFLESKFNTSAIGYCYPGGYITEEMLPLAKEFGYQFAFTIQPAKVDRNTPDFGIPRYMILGTHDRVFELATTFREPGTSGSGLTPTGTIAGLVQHTDFPVSPEPGAIINTRLPEISVNFAGVESMVPESLVMEVGGYCQVPATYDPVTQKFSWLVNRRLRNDVCQVRVTWKDSSGKPCPKPLMWTFRIDREAAYLPEADSSAQPN